MSEAFTAVEYAVLVHLKTEGRCTIPTIAADLLLRPSEVEATVSDLVKKNCVQKDGDFYTLGDIAIDIPFSKSKGSGTVRMERPSRAPTPPPMSMPDVANVFKQARERSKREKASGSI